LNISLGERHDRDDAFEAGWRPGRPFPRRRRQKQIEEAELRSLDARTLADLGIEFAPELNASLVHSRAEAVSMAFTAVMHSDRKGR
jgi:hypothetical protein